MIQTYKKKPVEVQAIKFEDDADAIAEISSFVGSNIKVSYKHPIPFLEIETLEGTMRAIPGDYIIRGVNGEFYPCKPDIFEKTYEVCSV